MAALGVGTPGSPPRAWGMVVRMGLGRARHRFTPTGVGNGVFPVLPRWRRPVHPHGRGEWGYSEPFGGGSDGSPPRAWGMGQPEVPLLEDRRFTPTGVGNGSALRAAPNFVTVHPHGRGEWCEGLKWHCLGSGSPPRAWGMGFVALLVVPHRRFTPTGVGNGCPARATGCAAPVHPHGRGEWYRLQGRNCLLAGSPPRAWGMGLIHYRAFALCRFTPTGVGNGT